MADKKKAKTEAPAKALGNEGWQERLKSLGRNDECSCGSKKKYKKCHLRVDEDAQSAEMAKVNAAAKAKAEKEAAEHEKEHGHDHAHDHDHPHETDHGHDHPHGYAPNAALKPPTVSVKQVSAPRKVGSGG